MSEGPLPVEAGRRVPGVRAAGKGPLLLAKLVISYLDKRSEVFGICFDPKPQLDVVYIRATGQSMASWWRS